jgi:membrane fusion protein, multidrug efflux system
VGDYINTAQPVFSLLSTTRVWVEANFKETDLTHMRPGQRAKVTVDTYPGHALEARVTSLSPGTGSAFSLLPAENATGNWVKVVQRLPVRLQFDELPKDLALRAGMSLDVEVETGHRRFGSAQAAEAASAEASESGK